MALRGPNKRGYAIPARLLVHLFETLVIRAACYSASRADHARESSAGRDLDGRRNI